MYEDNFDINVLKKKFSSKYSTIASSGDLSLAEKSLEYVYKKSVEKKQDKSGRYVPSYSLKNGFIYIAITDCVSQGFALDGINFVLAGNRMVMPTYHAFKNKLYSIYPETVIDLQIVREGDDYNFAKESGSSIYSHAISDPFEAKERKIIGAYCIIKNQRGDFLEFLNQTDYKKMRDSSKNPLLWDKWESEFWLKSVIKRACKRHFHDITDKLSEIDNKVSGLEDIVKADKETKDSIIEAMKAEKSKDA